MKRSFARLRLSPGVPDASFGTAGILATDVDGDDSARSVLLFC